MAEPSIRPYRRSDLEDVRSVCFETGYMGEPIAWQFDDREVFCQLFCDPHLLGHPDSAWVVDLDGRAVGYLIGSPDTRGTHDASTHRPFDVDAYPADLHINLLPPARGRGLGEALMATWFARLAELGVPGVHLGTWGENSGAIAFFESLGFREVGSRSPNLFTLRDGTQATVAQFVRPIS